MNIYRQNPVLEPNVREFEEEEPAPVLSPEEQEERNRREIEQRKILRQRQAMMRRMLSDYEY